MCGKDHPDTADTYNSMANVYKVQGDYDVKALELYGRARAIYEEVHGKDHPATAGAYYNIGLFFLTQGKHPEAK